MEFTQPCFIRKNTPELRKKLEELGYNRHPSYGDNEYLYLNRGFYRTNVIGYSEEIERMIDCGTNEELFLALAALRDDTDINQIYLWNEKHLVKCIRDYSCTLNIEATPYYMCQLIDNSDIKFEIPCKELRKATVEEIIEHFKSK